MASPSIRTTPVWSWRRFSTHPALQFGPSDNHYENPILWNKLNSLTNLISHQCMEEGIDFSPWFCLVCSNPHTSSMCRLSLGLRQSMSHTEKCSVWWSLGPAIPAPVSWFHPSQWSTSCTCQYSVKERHATNGFHVGFPSSEVIPLVAETSHHN